MHVVLVVGSGGVVVIVSATTSGVIATHFRGPCVPAKLPFLYCIISTKHPVLPRLPLPSSSFLPLSPTFLHLPPSLSLFPFFLSSSLSYSLSFSLSLLISSILYLHSIIICMNDRSLFLSLTISPSSPFLVHILNEHYLHLSCRCVLSCQCCMLLSKLCASHSPGFFQYFNNVLIMYYMYRELLNSC